MEQSFHPSGEFALRCVLGCSIDECYEHHLVGSLLLEWTEYVFVEPVGFSHLSFYSVAIHRVLKESFGHAH